MKNLIIVFLFFLLCFQFACSMGSKHLQDRDITKTFFWATNEQGIFKTQSCVKESSKGCDEWKVKYLDVKKDWDFIVNTRMILIPENMFFEMR